MINRTLLWVVLLGAGLAIIAGPAFGQQYNDEYGRGDGGQMMRGPMGSDYGPGYNENDDAPGGDWHCPWCGGSYGRGRMHRGWGRGMGPGMMHRGYDRGWGGRHGMMGPDYGRYGKPPEPLNKDQARLLVENYLRNRRNPNLKVGDVTDKEEVFEATIVAKDGSLVDKLEVDKETGWFRSVYDR